MIQFTCIVRNAKKHTLSEFKVNFNKEIEFDTTVSTLIQGY